MRRLYYNYLQQHPVHVPTPRHALAEAIDGIRAFQLGTTYAVTFQVKNHPNQFADNMISSSTSVVPFSTTECEDLMRMLGEIQGQNSFIV